MQRNGGGRDPFFGFGDPFGGFGGFGGQRSLISSFFGGRDPFDDPFFTRPFGGFESSFFGSRGSPFADMHPSGYLEHQIPENNRSRGPIIEEINSDDENKETEQEKIENPKKHRRSSKEPYVEDPDDEAEGRTSKHLMSSRTGYSRFNGMEPQPKAQSFSYQSSTVTYGGPNGAYYTSSNTRRMGSDGVMFEESKEADSSTRQATHRVSRGLQNKGHTMTRKLESDGRVDTMQTLHNLNQDELPVFEEAWKGNAGKHLPGWPGGFSGTDIMGVTNSEQNADTGRGGWALPSTQHPQDSKRIVTDMRGRASSSRAQQIGMMKSSSDVRDGSGSSRRRTRD